MPLYAPETINYLTPVGFELHIDILKDITFYTQRVTMPAMSLGAPDEGTPLRNVPMPGETIEFTPLTFDFLVDENMTNYKTIHNWMRGIAFPEDHEEYNEFLRDRRTDPAKSTDSELDLMYSNGTLTILNAQNKPNILISLIQMTPIYLSPPVFDATVPDIHYVIASLTLKLDRYEFKKII